MSAALLAALLASPTAPQPTGRLDAFDLYLNPTLARLIESPHVKEVKRLALDELGDHDRVLPGLPYAFLAVQTNEGRRAKLLVQAARHKVSDDRLIPMLLLERYVTYKEGEEQTRLTEGRNVALYPGFRLSLDRGQVVPEEVGGDLRCVVEGDRAFVEPVGKAKLFLVTKGLDGLAPPKGEKLVVGDTFETRFFNGTYRLSDDGRRSGKLVLKVDEEGGVSGAFYSDKDGAKYEVRGRVGPLPHAVQFTVQYPRTQQVFTGMLFTGDARALAGTSRMDSRESAFYAVRVDD
jgi:hypothetical protein